MMRAALTNRFGIALNSNRRAFFDRGIVDAYGSFEHLGLTAPDHFGRAVEARRRVQRESSPRRPEPVRPARILQWRPPPRSLPAPEGTDAFERVVSLTGALEERTPPRVVELAPPQAAAEILRQLHRWGYLTDAGAAGAEATAAKATGSEPTDPVTAEPRP